jgi:hypothetical protein
MCLIKAAPRRAGRHDVGDVDWAVMGRMDGTQAFGRSGPITVLTSPFAAVSAAAAAEAAAAAAAGLSDKQMDCSVVDAPAGQESSSDASHQTNGLAAGCGPQSARNS